MYVRLYINFLNASLEKNYNNEDFWLKWNAHLPYKPKKFPLESELRRLEFSVEHAYKTETILVDTILYLFFTVIKLALETADCLLLSPELRAAAKDVETYISYHHFLTDNNIHTRQELLEQIRSAEIELKALEDRRNKISTKGYKYHISLSSIVRDGNDEFECFWLLPLLQA